MFASLFLTLALGGEQKTEPTYEFKLRKAADTIVTGKEKERTFFIITSPGGIGGATLTLKAGQWPENVTLRFQHQQGKGFAHLENITLTTDRVRVEGNAKSSGKFRFCFLDSKKTPVVIGAGKREPAGALNVIVDVRKDSLDVTLPTCLLIGSGQVELSWIDVYRN